jgi:hypothetical protein
MDFLALSPANRTAPSDTSAICSVADQDVEVQARASIHATLDVTVGPHGFSSAVLGGMSRRLSIQDGHPP